MKDEFVVHVREGEGTPHYWSFDTLDETKKYCEARAKERGTICTVYQRLAVCEIKTTWEGPIRTSPSYVMDYFIGKKEDEDE